MRKKNEDEYKRIVAALEQTINAQNKTIKLQVEIIKTLQDKKIFKLEFSLN